MSRLSVTTPAEASALELVRADVLARHHRLTGARVRFPGGGDPSLRPLLDLSYYAFGSEPADSTTIFVHSDAVVPRVDELAVRYRSDAVRWWLLRDPSLDVTHLVPLANKELHKRLGNLVDRVTVLIHRYRNGHPPGPAKWPSASARVDAALRELDFVAATTAVWEIVEDAIRYLDTSRPWDLARAEQTGSADAGLELDDVLSTLLAACRILANELTPFVPALATRIAEQCFALSGTLAPPRALFPQLRK